MSDLKLVLTHKKVLLICALAGLMVGPMEGFADAWGSEFLKKSYHLDINTAHYLTSMIYIGMCFAPLLSRVAEKSGLYLETISGAGMVMLSVFCGLLLIHGFSTKDIAIGFFVVGVCCAYQILAIYKASTYVPERVSGLTTAVANMIIMSFGYVFHSSIGLFITLFNRQSASTAYALGIAVIPLTLFIGTLGFFVISRQEKTLNGLERV